MPRLLRSPACLGRRPHGARAGRYAGEQGAVSLEAVILAPLLLALVFGAVQLGMMYHARNVATSGAQFGYEAARVQDATAADGQAAASGFIADAAPDNMNGVNVTADRSGTTANVRVRANYPQIVPLLPLPDIDVHAGGPVERVTQP